MMIWVCFVNIAQTREGVTFPGSSFMGGIALKLSCWYYTVRVLKLLDLEQEQGEMPQRWPSPPASFYSW